MCRAKSQGGRRCTCNADQIARHNYMRRTARMIVAELKKRLEVDGYEWPEHVEMKPEMINPVLQAIATRNPEFAAKLRAELEAKRGEQIPGNHYGSMIDFRDHVLSQTDRRYLSKDGHKLINSSEAQAAALALYLQSEHGKKMSDADREETQKTIRALLAFSQLDPQYARSDMRKLNEFHKDMKKAGAIRNPKMRAKAIEETRERHAEFLKELQGRHKNLENIEPEDVMRATIVAASVHDEVANTLAKNTKVDLCERGQSESLQHDMQELGLGDEATTQDYMSHYKRSVIYGHNGTAREVAEGVYLRGRADRKSPDGYAYFYEVHDPDLRQPIQIPASHDDKLSEIHKRIPKVEHMDLKLNKDSYTSAAIKSIAERQLHSKGASAATTRSNIAETAIRVHYETGKPVQSLKQKELTGAVIGSHTENDAAYQTAAKVAAANGLNIAAFPVESDGRNQTAIPLLHSTKVAKNEAAKRAKSRQLQRAERSGFKKPGIQGRNLLPTSKGRLPLHPKLLDSQSMSSVDESLQKRFGSRKVTGTPPVRDEIGKPIADRHGLGNKTDVECFLQEANRGLNPRSANASAKSLQAATELADARTKDIITGRAGRTGHGRGNKPTVGFASVDQSVVKAMAKTGGQAERMANAPKLQHLDNWVMVSNNVPHRKDSKGRPKARIQVVTREDIPLTQDAAVIGGGTHFRSINEKYDQDGNLLEAMWVDAELTNEEAIRLSQKS